MNKKLICFVTIAMLLLCFSISVSANSPPPPDSLTVEFTNLNDDVIYADLLIQIDKNDENFTEINQPNLEENGFSDSAEIVNYNQDSFRSFTFHYKNAKSIIKLYSDYEPEYKYASFCKGSEYEQFITQYEDLLKNHRKIKIALLNEQGAVISVSKQASLPVKSNMFNFYGIIRYNADGNSINVENRINPYYFLFGGIIFIFLIFFSVGLEVITAVIFNFRNRNLAIILIVNTVSQVLMKLLYFSLPLSYWTATIILEILIYGGEFLVYRKFIKDEKNLKILIYTIIANTISLLLGLWVIKYFNL